MMKIIPALNMLYQQLKKIPTPKGTDSREIVIKAVEYKNPPRIPYCMFYNPTKGDIFDFTFAKFLRGEPKKDPNGEFWDEWGVKWKETGYWWAKPIYHPLSDLNRLKDYTFPNPIPRGMFPIFKRVAKLARRKRKYIIAPNVIDMYERMRSVMGFEELMVAPYKQPELLEKLLDTLTAMTIELIDNYSRMGENLIDAFMIWEDWGLQSRLQMRVETFREFYKPHYKQIIDVVHENNMDFFWHSCGYIIDLLPEMIDLGVDAVQLDQPRLMGHQNLIDIVGGKICMYNTLDIQWSNQSHISEEDIAKELQEMIHIYNVPKFQGGYIFRNYPDPNDIQISKKRQQFINKTFETITMN